MCKIDGLDQTLAVILYLLSVESCVIVKVSQRGKVCYISSDSPVYEVQREPQRCHSNTWPLPLCSSSCLSPASRGAGSPSQHLCRWKNSIHHKHIFLSIKGKDYYDAASWICDLWPFSHTDGCGVIHDTLTLVSAHQEFVNPWDMFFLIMWNTINSTY